MNTTIIILIGVAVLLLGVGIGYYLRLIIALGKRRSIEIDIKQMMEGSHFAKSIADASWNQFRQFLTYKAAEAGNLSCGFIL